MNQLKPEEQAQRDLQLIKMALDAAVKGSVFPTIDDAFAVANSFNNIAQTIKQYHEPGRSTELPK